MNLLYPRFTWPQLRCTLQYAALGALVAGAYGILHDQVTFTISPEYFTRMKFDQFYYTDFGLPLRLRVGMIGFLATWWVGFIGVWFLTRLAIPTLSATRARKEILRGVATLTGFAIAGGVLGFAYGHFQNPLPPDWLIYAGALGVKDREAFIRVGYIHNGSYLGGFVGLVTALVILAQRKRSCATETPSR